MIAQRELVFERLALTKALDYSLKRLASKNVAPNGVGFSRSIIEYYFPD